MPGFTRASALLLLLALSPGCGDAAPQQESSGGPLTDPELALSEGRGTVVLENAAGERVTAAAFVPAGTGPFPGVVVLHGSGGLFDEPSEPGMAIDPATADLESQFEDWGEILTDAGYVALMPASFYSRGFFDWNEDAPADISDEERLRFRVLDAHEATLFLCRSPSVDCDKLALLGFSNGASTVLMSLADGVAGVAGLESLEPAPLPVALGVAYYPGCGLQSLVSLSEPAAYYPTSPVQILHAELDPLLEHCPTRVMQAAEAAEQRDLAESPLSLHVYEGEVDHGFDSSPDTAEEEAARSDARARTLDSFANGFARP